MSHGAEAPPQPPSGAVDCTLGDCRMTWETPTAIDWRFGFEISLYVANR